MINQFVKVPNVSAVDDTFGKTDVGGSLDVTYGNQFRSWNYSLTIPAERYITNIKAYLNTSSGTQYVKFAVYRVTGGVPWAPTVELIGYSAAAEVTTTAQWIETELHGTLPSGTDEYYIGFKSNGGGVNVFYDEGDYEYNQAWNYSCTYGDAFPSTMTLSGNANYTASIYVTYSDTPPPTTITVYNVIPNATRAGNTTAFHASFECFDGLAGAYFESNSTGSAVNSTFQGMSGTDYTWIYNLTMPATVGDVVQYRYFVNATTGDWSTTDYYNITLTNAHGSVFYIDGKDIKYVANGTVAEIKGTNYIWMIGSETYPVAYWAGRGDTQLASQWSVSKMHENLDAMALAGFNAVRMHFAGQSWIENETYRDFWVEIADYAYAKGITLIPDMYFVNSTENEGLPSGYPFPPYGDTEGIIDSLEDYADLLVNVTLTLDNGNFMIDLYNEPNQGTAEIWGNHSNYLCSAIRSVSDCPILYQWYYQTISYADLSWISDYPIMGTIGNIIYSTHQYDAGLGSPTNSGYDYINATMRSLGYYDVTQVLDKCLIIGEWGVNNNYEGEQYANSSANFEAFVQLCDAWDINWLQFGWETFPSSNSLFYLPDADVGLSTVWIPNQVGDMERMTINSIYSHPFAFSVGTDASYIYSNDVTSSTVWSSNQLKVTIAEASTLRVYWNVSDSYPVNSTLHIQSSNGTIYDAEDYYNATLNLLSFTTDSSTSFVLFGYGLDEDIYTLSLTITSPENTTYTTSSILISLSTSGNDTNPVYSWNVKFSNGTWLYESNQTSSETAITIAEDVSNALFACYVSGDNGESDYGEIYFSTSFSTLPTIVDFGIGGDISLLLTYLLAGDLAGFIIACYTTRIGQLFYAILVLCFTVPLAIRTQSITYVAIVWLILGIFFIPAVPLISPAAVLLLILGIGGLIYRVYTRE